MICTCSLERMGLSQKEHGWRPSKAQIILPHDRQFGAVSNSGCIEALQLHFLLPEESDGFVLSSRAAIAEVRSLILEVVVDLCGVDEPELWVAFFAALDFTFGRSEIREPDADGGNLGCAGGLRSRDGAGDEPM
jgi:hypothetical protein